jgi:lipid-A-disaccharide synthase
MVSYESLSKTCQRFIRNIRDSSRRLLQGKMKPKQIMLIGGEASGDVLGAELVEALRVELTAADVSYTPYAQPLRTGLEPRFFGAGGPRMAEASVELAINMTEHSIIGIPSLKNYLDGRRRFNELLQLAIHRQPDAIIGIDYNYFNLKFAHAIRQYSNGRAHQFHTWRPKLIKFISPQVWASRESRAYQIAKDYDLLLSIFPFEKEWYQRRVPKLHVEFVGHPMVDRFFNSSAIAKATADMRSAICSNAPQVLLLPGSRVKELQRHLPVMLDALKLLREKLPQIQARIVLPDEGLATQANALRVPSDVEIQIGNLSDALAQTDLAIASTGTVTMECAFFGVPAVTLYKTSWATYELGKRIVKVKSLTMPNLLAGEEVFPEFIQNDATPGNISQAALELLRNESRRNSIKTKLAKIVLSLGAPGASHRAARAIANLFEPKASIRS